MDYGTSGVPSGSLSSSGSIEVEMCSEELVFAAYSVRLLIGAIVKRSPLRPKID